VQVAVAVASLAPLSEQQALAERAAAVRGIPQAPLLRVLQTPAAEVVAALLAAVAVRAVTEVVLIFLLSLEQITPSRLGAAVQVAQRVAERGALVL
jgi:hypothetical protein